MKRQEALSLVITSLAAGFVLSFRDWGIDVLDVAAGITSVVITTLVVMLIMSLRVFFQRKFALAKGYFLEYTIHKWGLLASMVLVFFSNGLLPYFSTGSIEILKSKRLRLGANKFYGLNIGDYAYLAILGSAVSMVLMIIVQPLVLLFPENLVFGKIILASGLLAFFSLLPIPGSEGFGLLYYSRGLWVFYTAFVALFFLLALSAPWVSLVLALLFAGVITFVFKTKLE